MNILELIKYKDLAIEVSGINYNYFHVADFNNLHFSYGFCKEGWIINDNERSTDILLRNAYSKLF